MSSCDELHCLLSLTLLVAFGNLYILKINKNDFKEAAKGLTLILIWWLVYFEPNPILIQVHLVCPYLILIYISRLPHVDTSPD